MMERLYTLLAILGLLFGGCEWIESGAEPETYHIDDLRSGAACAYYGPGSRACQLTEELHGE